jgi:hypothetical protein
VDYKGFREWVSIEVAKLAAKAEDVRPVEKPKSEKSINSKIKELQN